MIFKSPITYHGCKYKSIKHIKRLLPQNIKTFYDVFGGSGTVAINMLINADKVIYNDLDWQLYNALKFLTSPKNEKLISLIRDNIEKYDLKASKEKINIVKFNQFRNFLNDTFYPYKIPPTEMGSDYYANQKAAAHYLTIKLFSFHGNIAWTDTGKISVTYGYDSADTLDGFLNKLKTVLFLPVGNLKYKNEHYAKISKEAKPGDFVYLDPPYYKTEIDYAFTWSDEMDDELFALLDDLNKRGVKWGMSNTYVHISGEHNDKLKQWAEQYHVHHFDKIKYNAFGNVNNNNREVYITNYATPKEPEQTTLF